MLKHQIEFSKAIAEIYKPISGRPSDPDSIISEGNPEGIQACEEYEAIVRDLEMTLEPELEMIDARVVKPALDLLEISKVIRKTATKRDHKQLDYDRHRNALKKLQDKKEKTISEEKALYKAENAAEAATQDYEYFNDMMKQELPKFFGLMREFIQPLFQSFYYMQLNVFYTLHARMQSIDIGYFDLQADLQEGFEAKRGDAQQMAEALSITKFKATGGRRPAGQRQSMARPAIEGGPRPLAIENGRASMSSNPTSPTPDMGDGSEGSAAAGGGGWQATLASKTKPPPPKPKPSRFGAPAPAAETVTALYDYEAQADGDLSFSAGDTIEIVTRTQNENEWWTGKVSGRQGQFPGEFLCCSLVFVVT